MSNKTNTPKTVKKNLVAIEWPTGHFTVDDVQKKYPDIINITLRFRVKKALESKDIVTIGKIKPAIGRPKLVFARANPSAELLEAAKSTGVILPEDTTSVPVAEVKPSKTTKSVVPATAATPAQATAPQSTKV